MRFKSIWLSLYFCLVCFVIGEGALESFINYPTWYVIGKAPKDIWVQYHLDLTSRIGILVIPGALILPITISLFWLRPKIVKVWTVWAVLFLSLAEGFITPQFFWPIQQQLDVAFSAQAVDKLIYYDIVVRKLMDGLHLIMVFIMIFQASKPTITDQKTSFAG